MMAAVGAGPLGMKEALVTALKSKRVDAVRAVLALGSGKEILNAVFPNEVMLYHLQFDFFIWSK